MVAVALKNILANDASFAAAIGNDSNGTSVKVYAGTIPQGESLPQSIISILTAPPLDAEKQRAASVFAYTIQLEHYDTSYSSVFNLAELAEAALSQYSGTVEGVEIENIRVEGKARDLFVEGAVEERAIQDFTVYVKF